MFPLLVSDDAEVVRRTPDANLHPGLGPGSPIRLGGWGSRRRSEGLPLSDPPSVLPKLTKAGGHEQVYRPHARYSRAYHLPNTKFSVRALGHSVTRG